MLLPATSILPSLCRIMLFATSSEVPIASVRVPSSLNDKSGDPSLFSRAAAKSLLPPEKLNPATTIFPSFCNATLDARFSPVPIANVSWPSPSNEESGDPLLLNRARANRLWLVLVAYPATTILPSLCKARLAAWSSLDELRAVVSFPSSLNDVSSDPSLL